MIDWLAEDAQRHAIVVAGRPYHTDPRLMRGIDTMLTKLGFAILCPTSSDTWATRRPHDPNCPPWKPGKHLARLARFAAENPQVDLVCLQSFGCGYDALSLEDARDILEAAGKPFTALKIDDLSDKAHLNIRLRTLAEGIESMSRRGESAQESLTESPKSENAQLAAQLPVPWPQHRMSRRGAPQSKASQTTQRSPKFRVASRAHSERHEQGVYPPSMHGWRNAKYQATSALPQRLSSHGLCE